MSEKLDHTQVLVVKAQEDLRAAKELAKLPDYSEEIVLFHCQQAVEKALKAYLNSRQVNYPKIHDLEALSAICKQKDSSFGQLELVSELTPYALRIRYDAVINISPEETASIIKATDKVLDFILTKVKT